MRIHLLGALLLAVPLRVALAGSTLQVPQQFPTIQAAVDAAADGDTVLVKGGIYAESVELYTLTGVTLRGQGKVVIDAGSASVGLDVIQSSGCLIEKIRVQGGNTGLHVVECTGITVSKCRVTDTFAWGIVIDDSANIVVRDSVVRDTGDDAIRVLGDACIIAGNRIESSADHGVNVVQGVDTIVSGNRILAPGGTGIFADSGSVSVIVTGNTVSQASNGGIALECNGFMLIGNVSKGAIDDGYQLIGNNGTALGNRATDNTEAGFVLVGNNQLLSGNVGKGNGTFDLVVQGSGNIVDPTNVFKTTGP